MNNLVPKSNAEIAAISNEFWSDLDQKDFRIPLCSIGQPTTRSANGKEGHFNFNNGKMVEKLCDIKIIVPKKTRVLYGEGDNPSLCASDNFFEPAKRIKRPLSSDCMKCFASQWGLDDPKKIALWTKKGSKGKLNPPLCKETYNLLLADAGDNPFFLKFQGTQLKVVSEKLFSRIKFEFGKLPPFAVSFDISLEKIENGNQVYYAASFDNFKELEDYSKGAELYQSFSKKAQDILSKEFEEMDQAAEERTLNQEVPTPSEEPPTFNPEEPMPWES